MSKTIVLSEQNKIASIYDNNKVITDLRIERGHYQIGDIYLGIVESVLPSINASFIILDQSEGNGFIHINNLGHLKKDTNNISISSHLSCHSVVMVQILKEPTGNKGPTVSGEISLKGRYLTLLPFGKGILFSKNFDNDQEALYFKTLFSLLKPRCLGIIVHKTAINTKLKNLIQDFYALLYEWNSICERANLSQPPALISRNKNFISKILQKIYTDKINNIVIDSFQGSKKVASIITRWTKKNNVLLSISYFNSYEFLIRDYNLDLIVYDLLQSRVNLLGGGYIIIEKTEALTTIDVNSGSFNHLNNPRETILLVNRKAAKQIARHIKLRNLSGVIIIDFIDMNHHQDQLELLVYFDSFLKQDPEKPRIIQFSELGLVELTRKRQGKSLGEIFFLDQRLTWGQNYSTCIIDVVSKYALGHSLFLETSLNYSV